MKELQEFLKSLKVLMGNHGATISLYSLRKGLISVEIDGNLVKFNEKIDWLELEKALTVIEMAETDKSE